MPTPCDLCQYRGNCDFLAAFCSLADAEVARFRPDLIKPTRAEYLKRWDATKRQQRIDWDNANADNIFAARRIRLRRKRELCTT